MKLVLVDLVPYIQRLTLFSDCLVLIIMKTALLLASIAAASAFAPASQPARKTSVDATKADLVAIAEKANPTVKFYDPLNLAEQDFYGFGNEATIGWLRHSEIKVC